MGRANNVLMIAGRESHGVVLDYCLSEMKEGNALGFLADALKENLDFDWRKKTLDPSFKSAILALDRFISTNFKVDEIYRADRFIGQ
jgi:hypothetical protein